MSPVMSPISSPTWSHQPRRILLLFLSLSLTCPIWSLAQQGLGEVTLFGDEEDEFTIQAATKTEIPLSDAPGAVTVIGRQQIRNSGARTIPELLRLVAGVNVRWNPMVQTLDMRSFGQNPFTSRVLLLIDGVPYNSWNKGGFPQHPGFDFFALQNVKQIEVLRGPGSSLYGENAYWGVVNIVTLSGEDLEGARVELHGGDLASQTVGVGWGKSFGEGSVYLAGRYQQGQLPTAFWFEENDSEASAGDLFVKARYKGVEASLYRYEDEVDGFEEPIPLPFLPPGAAFASIESVEQEVTIAAFKVSHEWDNGVTFGGDISYAQRDGSHCGACHAAPQDPAFRNTGEDHGSQLIGDFRLGFQMVHGHDILVGVEARDVDSGDHAHELLHPDDTGDPVVLQYEKVAVYAQDRISFADDRGSVILGVRWDDSNDLFDSEVSPRIAVVFDASDRWVLRGGWSQAFRFPSFSELYQDSWFINVASGPVAVPLASFIPNPGLQPEQIETSELGAQVRINDNLSAKLDLYRSELDDFIVIASVAGGFRSENHPETATITGAELELRWASPRFNAFANWAYQDTERGGERTDSGGTPLELVYAPENKVNLAAYFGPFAGFRGGLEVNWRDDFLAPSFWNGIVNGAAGPAAVDGYTLVNARLSYDLPFGSGSSRPSRISLYGKNLLDEDYIETLIGTNPTAPGRTFYGALEFWF